MTPSARDTLKAALCVGAFALACLIGSCRLLQLESTPDGDTPGIAPLASPPLPGWPEWRARKGARP